MKKPRRKKEMALALEGIKIVEVAQVAAVPMASRLLADWGADVIHVEHPAAGDIFRTILTGQGKGGTSVLSEVNYIWESYNRNKRSVTIDLSQEGGREILYKLVKKADVFLTNMRPFELQKYNLEYATLSQINSRLICGFLTGYGKKGSGRDDPAYDHTAFWARSGIPHRLAMPTMPEVPPPAFLPAFGDNITALALACGIMTALFDRERTGVGQEVDISLFHTGIYSLSYDIAGALVTGQDKQQDERKNAINVLSNSYRTKDGRWLLLVLLQPDRYWSRFCRAIEREDLEHDPRFASFEPRIENHVTLFNILEEVFLSKTLDEWEVRLNEAGLPWSPVQNFPEVISDPQARANDFFIAYEHPTYGRVELVANPIKLSQSSETVRMPAPEFGQHTEEVLLECGYTWEDVERLKQQRIIA